MATFVNIAKNSITPSQNNKGGYALWGDVIVTWGSAILTWGSPSSSFANVSKNAITPTNITKN